MRAAALATALATAMLGLLVAVAALDLRDAAPGLADAVSLRLGDSGVAYPVTAVLLNFRGYDTWLELIVLLLAVLGALDGRFAGAMNGTAVVREAVRDALVRVLVPVMVLVAGLLLERGTYAPGGAFQAGAVLAAAVVLLHLVHVDVLRSVPAAVVRVVLATAVAAFTVVAVAGLLTDGALLQLGAHRAGLVLLLESAATVAIALALALLVTGRLVDPQAPGRQ